MLKNYIKIAFRNLTQHKSYTLLNLMGLAVGMACCILIALYIREELSFDTFHPNADRITAVGTNGLFGSTLSTPYPLADAMVDEIPQVEKAIRLNGTGQLLLSRDGQDYTEIEQGLYTDPEFFDVFSFKLLKGSTDQALSAPNSIVLSEDARRQLFGNENAVGQSLFWEQRDTVITLQVTGVVQDYPQNSSIKYEALVSGNTMPENRRSPDSWSAYSFRTFALLKNPDALQDMPAQLKTLAANHYKTDDEGNTNQYFYTIPLTDYHLSEETDDEGFTGNRAYVYLFGSVALFILVIACVNYINLATARASVRAKEVGVRKALGAGRLQVAGQFIGESVILSVGAFLLGSQLALWALPFFNDLFGTSVEWQSSAGFLLWLIGASIVIGIAAGLYPSAFLSRFTPSTVLRNKKGQGGSGVFLRKTLVVGQFAIALVLIIGALVIYRQLQFTQTKDLGFEGEQVVSVNFPNRDTWDRRDIIFNELAGQPGIKELSVASGSPGDLNIRMGQEAQKFSPKVNVDSDEETILYAPAVVDYNFLDLLQIDLIAGRNFARDRASDQDQAYIINKKMAQTLGWRPEEAVSKPFLDGKIIGVTENFHISSLHKEIEGVVLQLHESNSWYAGGNILAKLAPGNIPGAMDRIKSELKTLAPHAPFDYEFLDDRFDAMYRTERRLGEIVSLFTFISIIIACFGLYGLAAFSAERRIKEIGIRKVMGATISNIVTLLSKDFLKLVILGFLIAIPIAWYIMNLWLQDFAYRIEIGISSFVITGVVAVLVALITVSWQSVRAAIANPVDSLRSE